MRYCERCLKLVKVLRDSDDHTQWICDRCYFNPKPIEHGTNSKQVGKTKHILTRAGK